MPQACAGIVNEKVYPQGGKGCETFEKCSILVKFKEGENFNRRNTFSILRIGI